MTSETCVVKSAKLFLFSVEVTRPCLIWCQKRDALSWLCRKLGEKGRGAGTVIESEAAKPPMSVAEAKVSKSNLPHYI